MGGMTGFGGGYANPVQQMPTNLQNYIGGTGTQGQRDNMGGMGMGRGQYMSGYRRPAPMWGGGYGGIMGGGASWPGQGYGGMPGRFGQGPHIGYGGAYGGGMHGYGGFSPWGYGPASHSPWSSGMMGFGGGSGMYGGPMRPFSGFGGGMPAFPGFNPAAWAQSQAQQNQIGGGQAPPGTGGVKSSGQVKPYNPAAKPATSGTKANPKPKKKPKKKSPTRPTWWQTERCCFVAGTVIRMADGTDKYINDVEIGDIVLGMNGEENTVVNIERPLLGDRKVYSFNHGDPFVTAEHPFMTSVGWKSISPDATYEENPDLNVEELAPGDLLETVDTVVLFDIHSIQSHTFDPETPLYNLMLDGTGNHTYYADGFLVHNKAGD